MGQCHKRPSYRKQDAIWTCRHCHCSFHINCIQRWAKDCLFQQKNDLENEFPDLSDAPLNVRQHELKEKLQNLSWGCPKCRFSYTAAQVPERYECYCGKVADPPFDPWLVPHSCGESCGKPLEPTCGHKCLILCHPGPCPPCPKVVTTNCFCGQSAPAAKRCSEKAWSCGKPCGKLLACGLHKCPRVCHAGPCGPCKRTTSLVCRCSRTRKDGPCSEADNFTCEEKCQKRLSCGHHVCEVICCKGPCPPCPLSQERRCPCGKTTHSLPCTVATPTCGDTCGKLLDCGLHTCQSRCHRGKCGDCTEIVQKICRCGKKSKNVPCSKAFACDSKCKKLRDCKRHPCNRKCCDGLTCPPCEQNCNKTLPCKNHKCASRCHQGSCYPCNLTKELTCACGHSRILVPCGREKMTAPPKCKQLCRKSPDCHHEQREPHKCHFGECPPCRQICGIVMSCGHSCKAKCHDNVKVVSNGPKASVPWEETGPRQEIVATKCPDCSHLVSVTCPGGHETSRWPCHAAKSRPCGRVCGRRLACGNHVCQRECHKVKNAPNELDAGSNCRKCEAECTKPRPEGCTHPCPRPCHPGECDPCKQMVRLRCHCGLTQLYVKCGEWTQAEDQAKESMSNCGDQCPKMMSCGHRCVMTCHSGPCSDPSTCRKKVKVFCECKRRKEERQCKGGQGKGETMQCDAECAAVRAKVRANEEEDGRRFREDEERRQREELERFEKQMEGGKRKRNRDRRRRNEDEEGGGLLSSKIVPVMAVLTAAMAVILAWYFVR